MWKGIWEWLKGLFSGKGTTQIGAGNKSISAITIGNNAGGVVVGDGNVVHLGPKHLLPKNPEVVVRCAIAEHPFRGLIHGLEISLLNTTDRSLFVGNFLLELSDGSAVLCMLDCFTGEPQRKRELSPGDKLTFFIDVQTLRKTGKLPTDFVSAVVEDALGQSYKSDTATLQAKVTSLLKESQ